MFSYFVRYQTTFNIPSKSDGKTKETEESDRKLEEAVKKYPSKINWYNGELFVCLFVCFSTLTCPEQNQGNSNM